MGLKFCCPHCQQDRGATRVQGSDDLNHVMFIGYLREMWQCDNCHEYFLIDYEIKTISKLMRE